MTVSLLYPIGGKAPAGTSFQWQGDPAADHYQIWICQRDIQMFGELLPGGAPGGKLVVQASEVTGSGGVCTFVPGGLLEPGMITGWNVSPLYAAAPGVFSWTPIATFYTDGKTPGDAIQADDAMIGDYMSDYPGQGRLIAFVSTSSGGPLAHAGEGLFAKGLWVPLSVADLVPYGTKAIRVLWGQAFTLGTGAGDLIGWVTRRHGSTKSPTLAWYGTAARAGGERTILLDDQGRFDFMWDTQNESAWGYPHAPGDIIGELLALRLVSKEG